MRHRDLDPQDIVTVNVPNAQRLEALVGSMKVDGWLDRRLLVEEVIPQAGPQEPSYHAWTGSHRICAALKAGLPIVPCLMISATEADEAFSAIGPYNLKIRYASFTCWRDYVDLEEPASGVANQRRVSALRRAGLHDGAALLELEE